MPPAKTEIHERTVDVARGAGPVSVSARFGAALSVKWTARLVRGDDVVRTESGFTDDGEVLDWTLAPDALPSGAALQVLMTLMAPDVVAPWQARVKVEQAGRDLLSGRGRLSGEVPARSSEGHILVVEVR